VNGSAWFVASPGDWFGDQVLLDTGETHHALHVLRIAPGQVITVSDGSGIVARCSVGTVRDGRVAAEIIDQRVEPRPEPEIVLYQAAPKGSKIDAIVERSAELGVAELCVFESLRSVVRWEPPKLQRLATRWKAAARVVAKQSRNPYLMRTGPVLKWAELIDRIAGEPCALTLWEDASERLRAALPARAPRVALVVGPEGGFSAEEADTLAAAGAAPVSLGPRIFRTEIAPLVAASAVLWHYGVIG
jgi:16S rRNA (uracil1498-N3)-methyltransferase